MSRLDRRLAPTIGCAGLALLAAACSNTLGLPKAALENTVDTVSLFALSGTPVTAPSAYSVLDKRLVRTDLSTALDFAFDIDSSGRALLLPTQKLGLGANSGLQRATAPFDAITEAPTGGWVFDSAFVVDSGSVMLVRSRPTTCITGITVSLYAKLQVLVLDRAARRLDFAILVDQNCGYRGLAPGLPTQ
jgi:hypothetical protein